LSNIPWVGCRVITGACAAGREIIGTAEAKFEPFDQYGEPVAGLSWFKLNYDPKAVSGNYLLRFGPGARSLPHVHTALEEFLVLEGELVDSDGTVFKPGDFIRYLPGSQHFSASPRGCVILVFLHGPNRLIDGDCD
jgi:quercetin dioxygenase-like cupin family protein